MLPLMATLLLACGGPATYPLQGTVLEVRGDVVIVDHDAVPGFMDPMIMPFHVADPGLLGTMTPGDRIQATLELRDRRPVITQVAVTGHPGLPDAVAASGPAPIHAGQVFPKVEIPVSGGGTWTLGEGQPAPTVLAFLYTRCPVPEFCPMLVSRLQALQAAVGHDARILAVTLDPERDTIPSLDAFATTTAADPAIWRFGRLEGQALKDLAMEAALSFGPDGEKINHTLRLLVLDAKGRVVERYDDNAWPLDRVVEQLRTGGPAAPPGTDGTLSAPPTP